MILLKSLLILLLVTTTVNAGERVTILTLNVAGLPDALTSQDYPHMRMALISNQAQQWDLVAYQEDFYYSRYLDGYDNFETTYRGTKWKRWAYFIPWLKKSGLTIKTNWETKDLKYYAYKECNGHVSDANDCWVPKGVMCTRTMTPGGVTVDFCTTHLDAGDSEGDSAARRAQIKEYLNFMPLPELDTPYMRVETGDFNLHRDDVDLIPLLADRDIIVIDDRTRSNVDFITITTNDLLTAKMGRSGEVPKFNHLSDHPAIGLVLDLEY